MPGLLALLAHPDDEYFCAGLLAAVAARGVPVHLAWWTRGEGGTSPQRRFVYNLLPRAWHFRAGEARRSARALGASSAVFLGAVDPVAFGNQVFAPKEDLAVTVGKIEKLIAQLRPDLLLTHGAGGEYGHAAHRSLHQAARSAAGGVPLITFAAALPPTMSSPRYVNRDEPADYILDSQPFDRQKVAVVREHRSQTGVFEKLADPQRRTLERLLEVTRYEGYHAAGGEPARGETVAILRRWLGDGVSVI
jgi:LmbE family N-acetylglucosaminyl deacetylase